MRRRQFDLADAFRFFYNMYIGLGRPVCQYLPWIIRMLRPMNVKSFLLGNVTAVILIAVIPTFVTHQYSSQELLGPVQAFWWRNHCSPDRNSCRCDDRDPCCVPINKNDYEKVGNAHSLRFHLERSGRNGLRTDKIYPCLTREIHHTEGPYRVVANKGKLLVSERQGHFVSVRDLNGTVIRKYGSKGKEKGKMIRPGGIALDDEGFVYVTSDHKLQKFTPGGSFITEVGDSNPGNQSGKAFDKPHSVAIRKGKVYVCDSENNQIQVFDLNLEFIKPIATNNPQDIAFDNEEKMYVTSRSDHCVYVFDESGNRVRQFGQPNSDGIGLNQPTGIHIYGNYALVTDERDNGIMVYSIKGQFITSFEGFGLPRGITSDDKGQIYICDYQHYRIVVL